MFESSVEYLSPPRSWFIPDYSDFFFLHLLPLNLGMAKNVSQHIFNHLGVTSWSTLWRICETMSQFLGKAAMSNVVHEVGVYIEVAACMLHI